MQNFLTFKEMAEILQIPVQSIYLYHYRGEGPTVHKFGKHLRVLEEDFSQWQEKKLLKK